MTQRRNQSPLNAIVPPQQQRPKSAAQIVKERLEWGEPGFTIIDVRDRSAFNDARIMGAIPMPMNELVERAQASGIESRREIYVYGESDEQSAQGAAKLREAGYFQVAELQGGLAAWKTIGGSTEGTEEQGEKVVGKGAYNVAARLDEQAETQAKYK